MRPCTISFQISLFLLTFCDILVRTLLNNLLTLFPYFIKKIVDPLVLQLAKEYKESLQQLYGDELYELILFGSYARGQQHAESDLYFAIVLRNNKTRAAAEIARTSVVSSRLSLKYGIVLSSLPVSVEKKQHSMQGIYQEMRNEGIVI